MIYKLTLNFPSGCNHFRDAVRLLHKWRFYCSAITPVSFTGGIFRDKDQWGKLVFHSHLCFMTAVPDTRIPELARIWEHITSLPSSSFDIEPIKDLGDWLNYIFIKNVKECENWKLTYYRQEFLTEIFNKMEEIYNGKKTGK